MQAAVRTSDRAVLAIGIGLAPPGGAVVEALDDATLARLQAALATVVGDGAAILSADHATIAVQPPSAAWQALDAATRARLALMAQHRQALETIAPTINATPAQVAADIAGVEAFVAALEGGTAPTGVDLVRTLRFLLRIAHARA